MLCLTDITTDPYYNLAAEEYLLCNMEEPIFRLWRNEPSVICGRYQNARAEINSEYIHTHGIPVVRRLTGGGAVFHDLGNINFTFIEKRREGEDTSSMFRRFTAPIIDSLRALGIDASLEGRNDLTIGGRKFSGNAICMHHDRILQHGTLLFSASMTDLSKALNTRPEKFTGKSVKSNISRVTNISEHLPEGCKMSVTGFMQYIHDFIISHSGGIEYHIREFTEKERREIGSLKENKYITEEWCFGNSPKYAFSNTFRLPCGFFEVFLNVEKGIITRCRIMGDYFFLKPTEEICRRLTGIPHTYNAISEALAGFEMKEYFGDEIREPLIKNLL